MKAVFSVVATIAFLGNALANGWVASSNLFEEEEVILSSPTDGSSPVESQRKLATGSSLPLDLPIGSPEKLRDFIVSDKASHGLLNVFVRLGFQPEGTTDWVEIGVQKATYGYPNWVHALEDIRGGAEVALEMARVNGKKPDVNGVWAVLRVWYWCDIPNHGIPGDVGLSLANPVASSLEEVEVERMLEVFQPGQPVGTEQAIIRIDGLDYIHVNVDLGTNTQELEWSVSRGVSLANNWPPHQLRLVAVNYLFIDRTVATGRFPSRFMLGIGDSRAAYTQYGSQISPPVMGISATGSIVVVEVRSTPGSDLEVFSSTNGTSWSLFQRVTNVTGVVRGVITNAPPVAIFKATSR